MGGMFEHLKQIIGNFEAFLKNNGMAEWSDVVFFVIVAFCLMTAWFALLFMWGFVRRQLAKRQDAPRLAHGDYVALMERLGVIEGLCSSLKNDLTINQNYNKDEFSNLLATLNEIMKFMVQQDWQSENTNTAAVYERIANNKSKMQSEKVASQAVKSDEESDSSFESELIGQKIEHGLKKTRDNFFAKVKGLFSKKMHLDDEMYEELEALLVASDLGVSLVTKLLEDLKQELASGKNVDESSLINILKQKIASIVHDDGENPLEVLNKNITPFVIMVVGVNGVGKTTTVAKLAKRYKERGAHVLLAAADTFRAAACEQLEAWGSRIGVPVVRGAEGAKPSTVAFDAMQRATDEKFDVLIIDTAGRLQTQTNLMQELSGVSNIIKRFSHSAPHETLLVLDGTTGQNALSQAKEFCNAVQVSGVVVTKLDGTPKGGIVVAVKSEFDTPIRYIGVGEDSSDLLPFQACEFVDALFKRD